MAKNTTPDSLYGNSRDILREAERENEILADIAGEEYESPGDIPKGKYVIEKRLLDAAQKKNELLEAIAEGSGGGGGGGGGAAKAIGIDYATDIISLKNKDGETITGSGATLPAYGLNYDTATGGLTLTKNGTAISGQTVSIPDYGSPLTASSAAGMTDTDKVYVYTGETSASLTNGHWYYYDGDSWEDGGTYNSAGIDTDTTLLVSGAAADAKATGEAVGELKSAMENCEDITILNYSMSGYIRTDGSSLNVTTPVSDNAYMCSVINVSEGDVFTISATGGNVARPWAFIDENNGRLTFAGSAAVDKETIIAPATATKLVINTKKAEYHLAIKGNFDIVNSRKVNLHLSESLSSISSIVNNFLSNENVDIVELSAGNYKVYTTINVPDGKTLILQGDYKNNAIKPTVLTPISNGITMLIMGTKSKIIGGLIDMSTFVNVTAIKLDCHKTPVEYSSIVNTKIVGGREIEGNNIFSQTAVYIECDYLSGETVTTYGYMQFCYFDIDIRSLGIGYRFHRQLSTGNPSTGVWLTNNDIFGFIYRCTRPIWYDFSDGDYANNNSEIGATFQAGALYTSQGEQAYPGVNILGKSIVISGRFWDFAEGRQNPAIYFEESSSGCFVLHEATSIGSWQFNNDKLTTNVTAHELAILSGYKKVTLSRFSTLITNFNNASLRIGDVLYIRLQFIIAKNATIPAGTNLVEILNEDALNMSYIIPIYNLTTGELKGTLQIYRSGTRTFIKNLTTLTYEDNSYIDGQCIALSNRINSYTL